MNQLMNSTAIASVAERLKSEPVSFSRTLRPDVVRTVTSANAGYAVPVLLSPLLREDGLETTRVQVTSYMAETVDMLLNTVHCTFSAYFVPKLAADRFDGSLDLLNRAYTGSLDGQGNTPPDWISSVSFADSVTPTEPAEFYKVSGLHNVAVDGSVNSDYLEAYLKVFEFRCRQRSEALWESVKDDYSFASGYSGLTPAFFDSPQMAIVKPSFDQDMLDGQVPLEVVSGNLPVQGIRRSGAGTINAEFQSTFDSVKLGYDTNHVEFDLDENGLSQIFAELEDEGITVSTANIDLARETAAWARVRNQYSGITDDDLIDLLMSGVRVPTQHMVKPMLLDRQKVPFGMTQRFASDAENLDVSATRGVAGASLTLRLPPMNTGGTIVVIAEVVPEQFWERSADYHLVSGNGTRRPDRLLDQLDPQAVEVVENWYSDLKHTDPNGVFGYAPLNHAYVRRRFNLGGKFYKDDPLAPWSENRNRIWASEPVDPTLSKEFYLATDLPREIFMAGSTEDNFEFSAAGDLRISGLTYIGPMLREATDDYSAIMDRVDMTRVQQPAQISEGEVVETETETPDAETVETQEAPTDGE